MWVDYGGSLSTVYIDVRMLCSILAHGSTTKGDALRGQTTQSQILRDTPC